MNIEKMILYFAKKNNRTKREAFRVIAEVKNMLSKGVSEKIIYRKVPEWCKKVLNESK